MPRRFPNASAKRAILVPPAGDLGSLLPGSCNLRVHPSAKSLVRTLCARSRKNYRDATIWGRAHADAGCRRSRHCRSPGQRQERRRHPSRSERHCRAPCSIPSASRNGFSWSKRLTGIRRQRPSGRASSRAAESFPALQSSDLEAGLGGTHQGVLPFVGATACWH